jgi:arabinofuranosyltransferase
MCVALATTAYGRARADREKSRGWLDGRWEGVATMERFASVRVAVGHWMRDHLGPDTVITVGAAGALPYASGLPTIDAHGLNDPAIAHLAGTKPRTGAGARPGHQLWAPASYIERRDPDLLCHVGHSGDRPPRRVAPGFRRGYAWACIEPDELSTYATEAGLDDVGYYCCRRPVDRVVGPFAGGGAR